MPWPGGANVRPMPIATWTVDMETVKIIIMIQFKLCWPKRTLCWRLRRLLPQFCDGLPEQCEEECFVHPGKLFSNVLSRVKIIIITIIIIRTLTTQLATPPPSTPATTLFKSVTTLYVRYTITIIVMSKMTKFISPFVLYSCESSLSP